MNGKKLGIVFSKALFFIVFFAFVCKAQGQQIIPLYAGESPNSIPSANLEYASPDGRVLFKVSRPTLTVYTPAREKSNGVAVIICPGGGYTGLWVAMEGSEVAARLNELGITAFVLKYRLPDDTIMLNKSVGPIQDAQQAIKLVRENSKKWSVDPNKIGIIGFSAGGHLAVSTGTHADTAFIDNPRKTSLRPDFMILVYPVITFTDPYGHKGSRENLLGLHPSQDQINFFSNELQVKANTPPALLLHAGDDEVVTVDNSILFYEAMQSKGLSCSLHLFPKGQHGFFTEPAHSGWFKYCTIWLQENKWINKV